MNLCVFQGAHWSSVGYSHQTTFKELIVNRFPFAIYQHRKKTPVSKGGYPQRAPPLSSRRTFRLSEFKTLQDRPISPQPYTIRIHSHLIIKPFPKKQRLLYFRLNEHPSVNRAFPPVGWHSTCEQPAHTTTVWACEKTVVIVKQPGHLTSMKKERGAGTRACGCWFGGWRKNFGRGRNGP